MKQHDWIGRKAKDKITGFEGILTGRAEYLTGCDQFLVQPAVKKGGDYAGGQWFDENRLTVQTTGKALVLDTAKDNGPCGVAPVK